MRLAFMMTNAVESVPRAKPRCAWLRTSPCEGAGASPNRRLTCSWESQRLDNPAHSSESARVAAREIVSQRFCMVGFRLENPARCLVPTAEASQRESIPLEVQDRVVAAQAAHHALQALHCPSHGATSFLITHDSKKQALRPLDCLNRRKFGSA